MNTLPENSFWDGKSELTPLANALSKLIPVEGEVADKKQNRALEKFRRAQNCYYDLYNNGLGNRAQEFSRVFGFGVKQYNQPWRGRYEYADALFARTELVMRQIVLDAAVEQVTKLKITDNMTRA